MPSTITIAIYLLVVGAGASLAFQQVLNANLRVAIGSPWWAGFGSYLGGMLVMLAVASLAPGPRLSLAAVSHDAAAQRSRALRVFVIFSSVNWRRLNSVRHRVRIDLQMQYARSCRGHTATLDGAHFQKTEGLKLVQCAEQIGLRAVGQPSECRNRLRLCIAYRPQQAAIIRREDPDESLG
jgi:hypothetical protein